MNLSGTHPVPSPRATNNDDSMANNEFDKHQKYPLEMLRGDPFNLPTYINPSRKEVIDRVYDSTGLITILLFSSADPFNPRRFRFGL